MRNERSLLAIAILAFCGCAAVMAAQMSTPDVPAPTADHATENLYGAATPDTFTTLGYTVADIFSKP